MVRWSLRANRDLKCIYRYVEKDSADSAQRLITQIFQKMESVKDFPKSGRMVSGLNLENIREVFLFSYRIIYRIKGQDLLILAVVHGKRDVSPSWFVSHRRRRDN